MRTPAERQILAAADEIKRAERKQALKARVKPVVPVRDGKQRAPRVRNNAFLQWLRRQPCLVCILENESQTTRTQACHIRCGYPERGWPQVGMQEKPDDVRAWPGCEVHHLTGPNAQHKHNEREWWKALGIHPVDLCDDLVMAFANGGSAWPVFERYLDQRRPLQGRPFAKSRVGSV